MPRIDYAFSNLLGVMYRQGNIIFSHDGLCLYSPVGHRVTKFTLANQGETSTFSYESYQPIVCMAQSACGRLLLVVDEKGGAGLINVDRNSTVARIAFNDEVSCCSFSHNGMYLAVAVNRRIQVWRVPSVERGEFCAFSLVKTMSGHSEKINSVEWSGDDKFLVTSSDDMTCRVYFLSDLTTEEPPSASKKSPLTLQAHKHAVLGAFFMSGANDRILTVGKDGAGFEWRMDPVKGKLLTPQGGAIQHLFSLERGNEDTDPTTYRPWIADVRYNRHLGMLIIGYVNGSFGLFKEGLFEGDPYSLVHGLSLSTRYISAVAVSPNGQWLGFGSAVTGQLLVWEWSSETYILKQSSQQNPKCIAVSPDGCLLAAGGDDGRVRVWSGRGGQCLATFAEKCHSGPVTSVAFSRQGRVLVSAGEDGTVRAWDAVRLRPQNPPFRIMSAPSQAVKLRSVTVDGSGEVVVAGGAMGEVLVWSLRDGQLIDTLHGHEAAVISVAFDPVGTGRLMTASWDKTVRLWALFDRDKKMTVLEHESDVLSAVWRPDGREVAVACLSGSISIWGTADIGVTDADYVILRSIDVRRDISEKPMSGSHVKSLAYSLDGQFLFIAGVFPFIGLYDAESKVLLRRYPLSQVKKNLKAVNESATSDVVVCSPHGRSFSVLDLEGILMFSRDAGLAFSPFDLQVDLTPERVETLLEGGDYAAALALSCRLNISNLTFKVLSSVPLHLIQIISRTITTSSPSKYLIQILCAVAVLLDGPRTHYALTWTSELLTYITLRSLTSSTEVMGMMRILEKRLVELQIIDKAVREVKEECALAKLELSFSRIL